MNFVKNEKTTPKECSIAFIVFLEISISIGASYANVRTEELQFILMRDCQFHEHE